MNDPFADAPTVTDSALSYDEYKAETRAQQEGKSYEDIKQDMSRQAVAVTDLNNLPVQDHRWIDRGLVLSCEGANHPNHRSFKRQR